MLTTTHYIIPILLLVLLAACQEKPTQMQETENKPTAYRMFVGTGSEEGIFTMNFDPTDGSFQQEQVAALRNPTFLAISSDDQHLYSIHSVPDQREGGVSSFKINEDGSLTHISQQNTGGNGPCYISIDNTGKWVMVANYGSGSVSAFPIKDDGSLDAASDTKQHQGSSVNPERQEGPHAHYIREGIKGWVYAADLGTDKIMLYELENGKLNAAVPPWMEAEPGVGPRHIDFHPNQKYVYVMNELIGSVSVYDASDNFARLQTVSSLPDTFGGYNKSADIHIHPNGKFLYASNRGDFNSIAIFSIDAETGMLTIVGFQREGIAWPRNFAISPDGKYILVANRDDNSITSYHIDQETGILRSTGKKIDVPKPMCIQFLGG